MDVITVTITDANLPDEPDRSDVEADMEQRIAELFRDRYKDGPFAVVSNESNVRVRSQTIEEEQA